MANEEGTRKRRKKKKQPSEGGPAYTHSVTGHPKPGTQTSNARAGGSAARKPSRKMRRRIAQKKMKARSRLRAQAPPKKSHFRVHVGTSVEVVAPEEFIVLIEEVPPVVEEEEFFYFEEEPVEEEEFFYFEEETG